MQNIPIDSLAPGMCFNAPVYLEKGYILLVEENPVSEELIQRLKKWEYTTVFTDGVAIEAPAEEAKQKEADDVHEDLTPRSSLSDESIQVYFKLLDLTKEIFMGITAQNELGVNSVINVIKRLIDATKTNREFVLYFHEMELPIDNYLIPHSLHVALLSVALGKVIKLAPHKLIEVGIAGMLHDIGMAKIPDQLYLATKELTTQQILVMKSHTLLGYKILKKITVPEDVALGALEHHERLNGTGYPRGLNGKDISIYAKIVAVACSYETIIARKTIKESTDGHSALVDLLKGSGKTHDENIVKALIQCLSLYPIGAFVSLSNDSLGVVAQANPNDPKYPIVKVLIDENGKKLDELIHVKTSQTSEVKIVRTLSPEELKEHHL